jgi:hypothetical protein
MASLQPLSSRASPTPSPVRSGFQVQGCLSYSTLFKVLGVAVIVGLVGLIFKACKASSNTPKITLPDTTPAASITETPIIEALPNGIQQHHVDAALQIFNKHVTSFWDAKKISSDISISELELRPLCKGLAQYTFLFDYLKEKDILVSCQFSVTGCSIKLNEKYIVSARKNLKTPPEEHVQSFLECCEKHKQLSTEESTVYMEPPDGYPMVIPKNSYYVNVHTNTFQEQLKDLPNNNYFFDYLVQKNVIKNYIIQVRGSMCYILL